MIQPASSSGGRRRSGYELMPRDSYYSPRWVVAALFDRVVFPGICIDPFAGGGIVLDVAAAHGYAVRGSDIAPAPDAQHDLQVADFFDIEELPDGGSIITNPPYGALGQLAAQIIRRCLELTHPGGGKVAMLLRVDFDSASTRADIFGDHPAFAAKYALTRRVRWANLEQRSNGPSWGHAWFVWDWQRRAGAPVYGYLPGGGTARQSPD